jgi:hypothetical protein
MRNPEIKLERQLSEGLDPLDPHSWPAKNETARNRAPMPFQPVVRGLPHEPGSEEMGQP